MIYLVGMGPGGIDYLTPKALECIKKAHRVFAFPKHMEMLGIPEEKCESIQGRIPELPAALAAMDEQLELAVLVSGDPQVFSLSRRFINTVPRERWTLIPGIGSAQVMGCALGLQTPLPDLISLHGHEMTNLLPQLYKNKSAFVYTDANNNPGSIARFMRDEGFRNWGFSVGRNLGTPVESIDSYTQNELCESDDHTEWGLNLLYIEAPGLKKKGKIYGIGIGPGDPELITLKALKIIQNSDLIYTPRADSKDQSLARQIISRIAGPNLPFRDAPYSIEQSQDKRLDRWESTAGEYAETLKEGKQICLVTLGDPSLYSTFSYLLDALQKIMPDLDWEMIPGVSSIQLATARTGLPLALSKESCCILPAPEDMEELRPYLSSHERIIIMKIGRRWEALKAFLREEGLAEQSAFIKKAGLPGEYAASDLNTIDEDVDGALSVVLIRTEKNL